MTQPPEHTIELVSESVEQTWRLGERLAARLTAGDVVALAGPLGAGKTQWVKGIARGLGIEPDSVHSPTFTIVNEYPAGPAGRARGIGQLYHVDAYRLAGPAELAAIGFEELGDDGVVAVEWADHVADLMPPDAIWVVGSFPVPPRQEQRRYRITGSRFSGTDFR